MWMYDMRMKYFGDSINVMNRKAFKAYRYYIKDYGKAVWLLNMFDETYRISNDDVMDQNLLAYMNVIKVNKLAKKNLTDEQVLERYDVITNVIESKINALEAKDRNADKIITQKEYVDKILTEIVTIDCNFIDTNLGPKFRENPEDVKLVKRMFSFMLTGKCTDSELFLDVSKQLQKLEPNFGLAKLIGKKCLASGDYGCAQEYYGQALKYTDEGAEKAEVYIDLGKMETKRNNKSSARINYRKALEADAANRDPWILIGDLYYHSFEECKKMEDMVQDRLVFIAAYEMYSRGGSSEKMASAKAQFPSTEEIFTANYEKGQVMTISCWINESVKLESRD
jgi:tetratricopeptide (TPR) repeat protein